MMVPAAENRQDPPPPPPAGRWLLYLLAAIPPLAMLLCALCWAAWTPEPWDWREALGESPVTLLPESLLTARPEPHFLLSRALHVGLLYLPAFDVGRFCFVGWLLVLLVCGGILLLWRRTRTGAGTSLLDSFWLVLLAMAAFSPALGADWLLDARFRFFLPPLWLVAAVLLLRGDGRFRTRFAAAALLSTLAIFSDWSGAMVWLALAPLVWSEARRRNVAHSGSWLAVWCLLGNVGLLLCYRDFYAADRAAPVGIVAHAMGDPKETLLFFCRAAGAFGRLPSVPLEAAFGGCCLALLALLSLLLLLRRGGAATSRAMPWWSLAAFGAGAALLLTDRLFQANLPEAWLREVGFATLLLPIGLAGLIAKLYPAASRYVSVALVLPVALILLTDRQAGWSHLQQQRSRLLQAEAQLLFAEVSVSEMQGSPPPPLPPGMSPVLKSRGRLQRINPVEDLLLGRLTVAAEAVPFSGGPADQWILEGMLRGGERADLILATVKRLDEPERIARIALPEVAGDDRGKWRIDLEKAELSPGDLVRLYSFVGRSRQAVPFVEQYRAADGRLVLAERGK